jgi:hypothetical protein
LVFYTKDVFVVTVSTTRDQLLNNVWIARVEGSVRILPDENFKNSNSLDEVIFEEGVRAIGRRAFAYCHWLAKVSKHSDDDGE